MLRLLALIVGLALVAIGIIGILTPIPFGLVFLIAGLLLVIPVSPQATETIRQARGRWPTIDRLFHRLSGHLAHPYRRVLRRTEISDLERGPF